MLFNGSFFSLTGAMIQSILDNTEFDAPDRIVKHPVGTTVKKGETAAQRAEDQAACEALAALAEEFSSYAQGFKYDAKKCEVWLKPDWLKVWVRCAKERGYSEARVLMHGMRSNKYQLLAKDLTGFDMNWSQHGAKKWGFYASCSDHIASDYNAQGGKTTDGTAVIGLLLIKPNAGMGAYEHYQLGSGRGGPSSTSANYNDAYAVRDQLLWLPLGLATAKP